MIETGPASRPDTRAGESLIALLFREIDERYVVFGDDLDDGDHHEDPR